VPQLSWRKHLPLVRSRLKNLAVRSEVKLLLGLSRNQLNPPIDVETFIVVIRGEATICAELRAI
jgi:hypothetical protein